jgi:hypothetical protein
MFTLLTIWWLTGMGWTRLTLNKLISVHLVHLWITRGLKDSDLTGSQCLHLHSSICCIRLQVDVLYTSAGVDDEAGALGDGQLKREQLTTTCPELRTQGWTVEVGTSHNDLSWTERLGCCCSWTQLSNTEGIHFPDVLKSLLLKLFSWNLFLWYVFIGI